MDHRLRSRPLLGSAAVLCSAALLLVVGPVQADPRGDPNTAPEADAFVRYTSSRVPVGQKIVLYGFGHDQETPDSLTYSWDFGDGGSTEDSTETTPATSYDEPGTHQVTLTVSDPGGLSDTATLSIAVYRNIDCESDAVTRTGTWQVLDSGRKKFHDYCRSDGTGETVRATFTGRSIVVIKAKTRHAGKGVVLVDGKRVGRLNFESIWPDVRFRQVTYSGLGRGEHVVKVKVTEGFGLLDGFALYR